EQPKKPGFWDRLLGREAPAGPTEAEKPRDPSASWSEGAPDFTTGAEAGKAPAAEPRVTQASPDTPPEEKPPAPLAGADLQPVEGVEPEGGGPKEPIPRAEPAPQASPPATA